VRRFRFPAWGRIGFPLTAAPRARARRQDPALRPLARDALRARRHERRRPAPRGSVPGRVSEGGCLTARGSTHRAESRTARLYRPHGAPARSAVATTGTFGVLRWMEHTEWRPPVAAAFGRRLRAPRPRRTSLWHCANWGSLQGRTKDPAAEDSRS